MAGHHPSSRQAPDWHPADVKAALEKAGWSLRSLAHHHNLTHHTLTQALHKSYPASEGRIAKALGVHPMKIWPSRYNKDGSVPNRRGNPNWIARAGTGKNRSTGARPAHGKSARAG